MNKVQIIFDTSECKVRPFISATLNSMPVIDSTNELQNIEFNLDGSRKENQFCLYKNNVNEENYLQILKIQKILVDNIAIPNYVFENTCTFNFLDQQHPGSLCFEPSGIWVWNFQTPILTYILDQKIIHEAKYNQDYVYPWSYKLGPNSVSDISDRINSAHKRVQKLWTE